MKSRFILIAICFFTLHSAFGQQKVFRTSDSFLYGEFQDTLFEGMFHNAIIKMNPSTSEMKIVMFNDEIETNNEAVDSIFNSLLTATISLELTIDPTSYEDKENVVDNKTYDGTVLVTLNGVIHSLPCKYTIFILKTNNPYLKDMKLTLNLIIPLGDFGIDISTGLSEEIEIEITHGIINQ